MKQSSILLLIMVFTSNVNAQNIEMFNYNYPFNWNYDCNSMVMGDSVYYIAGDVGRIIPGCEYILYGYHITKINKSGLKDTTVIFDKCEQTTYIGWNNSMKIKDNNIYIWGHLMNYPYYSKLFLLKLDLNLDSVSNAYYMDDTVTKRAFNFVFDEIENIIFAGSIDSSYNEMTGLPETTYSKSYLCKASQNGEIIWKKSYSFGDISDGCWSTFHNVINTYDKGYIATGRTSDFGNSRNLILKTDSVGNQKWVRYYGNPNYDNPYLMDIVETQD